MSLTPRSADPPRELPFSEVEIAHPSQAADLIWPQQALPSRIELVRGFIERVRSDSLTRNSVFIMGTSIVPAAFGYVFWLVAAHLYAPAAVGLTAALTSAATILLQLSSLGVGGTLIQSLPRQPKKTEWSATFWAGMATVTVFAVALCGIGVAVLPLISPELR